MITWLTSVNTPFIKKDKEHLVREHKYRGTNDSIWSAFFVAPVDNFLLTNVIPEWVA